MRSRKLRCELFGQFTQLQDAHSNGVLINMQRKERFFALNVWAYFRQLSGKEIFAAAAYRYDEEVLFTINYRNDITTACFVEYNGVKYNVNRIDTFEGYKQDITLYCKRK